MRISFALLLGLLTCSFATPSAYAGGCGLGCSYEKTIYVPEYHTETRLVTCVEYDRQEVEKTYTVYRCVPEVHQVEKKCTVLVPEKRTKIEEYTVCVPVVDQVTKECPVWVPVWTDKEVHYTCKVPVWTEKEVHYTCKVPVWTEKEVACKVLVPHKEIRTGTRPVCRLEPVHIKRIVKKDCGHWEKQIVKVPCSDCTGCGYRTVCKKVWCPKIVTQEVPCTIYKPVVDHVPYEYCVTVCKPEVHTKVVKVCEYVDEPRTKLVKVCHYVDEPRTDIVKVCHWEKQMQLKTFDVCRYEHQVRTREVCFTEWVPHVHTKICDVTTYTKVAEELTKRHTVCVPVHVKKEVQVQVCRMVPKTVVVHCGGCGGCY